MSYNITVKRDGKFWYIEIPELDGATQARRLSEVDEMAKDYIHEITGEPVNAIELVVSYEMPATAQAHLQEEAKLDALAELLKGAAWAEARKAAESLQAEGVSLREAATLLGKSHQRVHQIMNMPERDDEWAELMVVFLASVEANRQRPLVSEFSEWLSAQVNDRRAGKVAAHHTPV